MSVDGQWWISEPVRACVRACVHMRGESVSLRVANGVSFPAQQLSLPRYSDEGYAPSSRIVLSPKILMSTRSPSISTSLVRISRIALDRALTSIEQMPRTTGFSPGASGWAVDDLAGEGIPCLADLGVLGGCDGSRGEGDDRREGEAGGLVGADSEPRWLLVTAVVAKGGKRLSVTGSGGGPIAP